MIHNEMSRRAFLRLSGGAAGMALLAACAPGVAPSGAVEVPSTEKITVRYAGLEFMGNAVETFLKPYMDEKGITLERGSFGQQELTDKIMQSVATGTYLADIYQFESNARADVIGAGAILEVPEEVQEAIKIDDVLPGILKTLTWEGKVFALPYDGDIHYYSFRKDLFGDAAINSDFKEKFGYDLDPVNGAATWEQWRHIAEFFTGWDWNQDGKTDSDYGIACMNKRGDTCWWGFNSRATAYAKHPNDPGYFLDTDTGEARVNNPGFVRALTEWVEENTQWAPPGGTGFGYGDSLNAINGGRAVQTYNWDAVSSAASDAASVIKDKQGYNILPGSNEVYNSKSGGWDTFEKPSNAPYQAFGGWVIAVSSQTDANVMSHVWDMVTHLSNTESGLWFVTNPTGCSPYRLSQLQNVDEFANGPLKLGEEVAKDYLDAAQRTLEHPNAVVDLAMPGWTQYRDALELGVSKALAGETDPQTALDEVKAAFDEISDRMGGLKKQAEIYKLVLGV